MTSRKPPFRDSEYYFSSQYSKPDNPTAGELAKYYRTLHLSYPAYCKDCSNAYGLEPVDKEEYHNESY